MEQRPETGRSFSLLVSSSIFVYHVAVAYLCTYLPSDPLYVAVSVSGYAWYSCILSFLGVIGSIKRSSALLTIFSNHLLIDTILSLVPKIGLLVLFHDLTSGLCFSSISPSFWTPNEDSYLHGPGRVTISPDVRDYQWAEYIEERHRCELSLSIARVLLIAILVFWTTAQWALGLYIRRYAVELEMRTLLARETDSFGPEDLEKAFYEEDSLADGYNDAVRAVSDWTSWRGQSEKSPPPPPPHSRDAKT